MQVGVGIMSAISSIFSTLLSWASLAAQMIGSWFTFKKMGLPGWKGIIPFYNYYVLFDTVWEKKKFWRYITLLIITVGLCILYAIVLGVLAVAAYLVADAGSRSDAMSYLVALIIVSVVFIGAMIAAMVVLLILMYKLFSRLAKCFGKSKGFAFGLLFLNPIFMMILGFDKSEYYTMIEE